MSKKKTNLTSIQAYWEKMIARAAGDNHKQYVLAGRLFQLRFVSNGHALHNQVATIRVIHTRTIPPDGRGYIYNFSGYEIHWQTPNQEEFAAAQRRYQLRHNLSKGVGWAPVKVDRMTRGRVAKLKEVIATCGDKKVAAVLTSLLPVEKATATTVKNSKPRRKKKTVNVGLTLDARWESYYER